MTKYAARRFFRIFPVYFITCITGFFLILYGPSVFSWHMERLANLVGDLDIHRVMLYEVFLMRGVYWPFKEILNPPAWSLGVEVSFYMTVPLYAFLTKRRSLLFAGFVFLLLLFSKHLGSREFGVLIFFWVGILIFEIEKLALLQKVTENMYLLMFILGLLITLLFISGDWVDQLGHHLFPRDHRTGFLAVGLFFLLLSTLKHNKVAGWFSWYPLRAIGIISYSLFLWHFPLFSVSGLETLHNLGFPEAMAIMIFLVLPGSLSLAGLSYVLIERPFLSRRV